MASPESSVHRPHGEERRADPGPGQRHHERGRDGEDDRPGVLHQQQPDPARGRHQQVPQGPQPGLAGDGVPRHHADGQRQEQRNGHQHRRDADEQAVLGDPVQERRARGPPARPRRPAPPRRSGSGWPPARTAWPRSAGGGTAPRVRTPAGRSPGPAMAPPGRSPRPGRAGSCTGSRSSLDNVEALPVSATKRSSRLACSVAKPRTRTPAATRAATTASGCDGAVGPRHRASGA